MKYTYKEYMIKEGIKSRNTVKARVKQGIIKEVRGDDNRLYIIDTQHSQIDTQIDTKIFKIDTQMMKNDYEIIINDLKNENNRLKNENKILNIQLENKDKFIANLELENKNKQDIIIGLQQQISEINQSNRLLLETSKEQKKRKKWYHIWK